MLAWRGGVLVATLSTMLHDAASSAQAVPALHMLRNLAGCRTLPASTLTSSPLCCRYAHRVRDWAGDGAAQLMVTKTGVANIVAHAAELSTHSSPDGASPSSIALGCLINLSCAGACPAFACGEHRHAH